MQSDHKNNIRFLHLIQNQIYLTSSDNSVKWNWSLCSTSNVRWIRIQRGNNPFLNQERIKFFLLSPLQYHLSSETCDLFIWYPFPLLSLFQIDSKISLSMESFLTDLIRWRYIIWDFRFYVFYIDSTSEIFQKQRRWDEIYSLNFT